MAELKKYFVRVPSTKTDFDGATVSAANPIKIYFEEAKLTIWNNGVHYGVSDADILAIWDAIGEEAVVEVSHDATLEDVDNGLAAAVGDKVVDVEAVPSSGLYEYIDNLILLTAEGAIYTEGTEKKITVGSIDYNLVINNDDHTISLAKYEKLNGESITGTAVYEYDDTTTSRTVTYSFNGTNKSTATVTWSGSTPSKTSTTGTGSSVTLSFQTPDATHSTTSFSVSALATDGDSTSVKKTSTVYFYPAVMWFTSTDGDVATVTGSETNFKKNAQSSAKVDNKLVSITTESFIYFACPSTYAVANFYLAKGTDKAALPGGMIDTGKTFTKYSKSTTYKIYRSTYAQKPSAEGTKTIYRLDVV